jgi:polyisoprenoid-binding protein YceI
VIAAIAHEKQHAGAELRRDARRRESGGAASNDRDGLAFFHDIGSSVSVATAAVACCAFTPDDRYFRALNNSVMRMFFALLAAALFMPSAFAADTFKFDPTHSRIGFKVHQAITNVTGRFKQFGGTIELDRQHPEKSSVTATIQVKSIDTGNAKRDAHLCSEEFFNAAKFPEITFKSRSVKQTGPDAGDILGDFTMHGVTKPITLHVKLLTRDDKSTRWQVATQPLSRREFGTQFGKTLEAVSMISDKVAIDIEIVATAAR